MTASDGMTKTSSTLRLNVTSAVMPGRSRCCGLGSSTRTRTVRLSRLACDSTVWIVPSSVSPAKAGRRVVTDCPGAKFALRASGTATSSQTVSRPLTRARVAPAGTVMPSRTSRLFSTPPIGLLTVQTGRALPVRSSCTMTSGGMPARRNRWRAAASSWGWPTPLSARYSSCAAAHSGTKRSANGAPFSMTSSGARS